MKNESSSAQKLRDTHESVFGIFTASKTFILGSIFYTMYLNQLSDINRVLLSFYPSWMKENVVKYKV